MSDEPSPDIINRLKRMPPFAEEKDAPPVVDAPEVEESVEEPEEVETPQEEAEETPEIPEEEVEEEVSEEEALANSKNPERTKKYIEKLKSKIPETKPVEETPKPHIPNAYDASEPENLVGEGLDTTTPPLHVPQDFATPKYYPNLSQKTIDEIMDGLLTTNEQGEQVIDIDKLRGTLAQANRDVVNSKSEAQKAVQIAERVERKFSDFEKTKEVVSVHESFPELDPESGKFNPRFYDVVKNEMVQQLIQKGQKNFMSAAQKWVDVFRKEEEDVTKKDREKKEVVTNAKKQINATGAHVSSQQRTNWKDPVSLAEATRKGQKGALAERLRRSGF